MGRMNFIAIDPGFDGTGCVIIRDETLSSQCTIRCKSEDSMLSRFKYITDMIGQLLGAADIKIAVVEFPHNFSLVASQTDSLIKLAFLTGGIVNVCIRCQVDVSLRTPNQWKGQLSKRQTDARVMNWIKRTKQKMPKCSQHARDAMALAASFIGEL